MKYKQDGVHNTEHQVHPSAYEWVNLCPTSASKFGRTAASCPTYRVTLQHAPSLASNLRSPYSTVHQQKIVFCQVNCELKFS